MKKLLISLSVLGWLGLMWVTSAFGQISCSGDGITVINADTTWCNSATGSTSLNNLLNNATARVAFHYADTNRSFNLAPDPFRALLDNAASRIAFHYADANRSFTLNYPAALLNDTTPPQISNLQVNFSTTGQTTITWSTDEFATSSVQYGTTPGNFPNTLTDPTYTKAPRLSLNGLTEGVTYYFRVRSTDLTGNTATRDGPPFVQTILRPGLAVHKQAAPNPVQSGSRLTYTILATNTGNMPLTATITDTLPAQVSPGGQRVWTTTLAVNQVWSQTLAVNVQANYTGRLDNVVRVTTREGASAVYTATSQVIAPPGTIQGRVTNTTANPLANITVQAYRQQGSTWILVAAGQTGSDGRYLLSGLSGVYRVYFVDRRWTYQPQYYNRVARFSEATTITVPANGIRSGIDAVLAAVPPPPIEIPAGCGQVLVDWETGRITIRFPRNCTGTVELVASVICRNGQFPTNVTFWVNNRAFPMTLIEGNRYRVSLRLPDDLTNGNSFRITARCGGPEETPLAGEVLPLWDPSGYITDAGTGQPIKGAKINLYRIPNALPDTPTQTKDCRTVNTRPPSSGGPFGRWGGLPSAPLNVADWLNPALSRANGTPEISPTLNPQLTGNDGYYGWDVVEGCWYIEVQAAGYEPLVSPMVGVPPAVTDLDLSLTPKIEPSPGVLIFLPLVIR